MDDENMPGICFQTAIESLGFPALDPYESKSTYIDYKRNQMSASLHVKNAKTYGISKAQILGTRATATDKTFNLAVDVRFPQIFMEGYFKGEGRFNSIKLASKGYFNNTMSKQRRRSVIGDRRLRSYD